MRLDHVLDCLDTEAAANLAVPLEEFQAAMQAFPTDRMSVVVLAALSPDILTQYRAQKLFRLITRGHT